LRGELRSSWIAAPDYPETSKHCVEGSALTILFDEIGRLVMVTEFADPSQGVLESDPLERWSNY
jgi:hypothetical protein